MSQAKGSRMLATRQVPSAVPSILAVYHLVQRYRLVHSTGMTASFPPPFGLLSGQAGFSGGFGSPWNIQPRPRAGLDPGGRGGNKMYVMLCAPLCIHDPLVNLHWRVLIPGCTWVTRLEALCMTHRHVAPPTRLRILKKLGGIHTFFFSLI